MADSEWTVGRMAARTGVKISTLHFYEKKGLIDSYRTSGNQRRYRADVVRRVSIIRAAQKMGISLAEVGRAFESLPDSRTPTAADWRRLSSRWKSDLDSRIAYLEKMRDYLTGCIGCGCLSMQKCPIYNDADHLAQQGSGPVMLERELNR